MNKPKSSNFDSEKDYYGLLGVARDAGKEEIERGFRGKAIESHPDKGGSDEQMKLLNEARDVLTSADARAAYDEARTPATIPRGSSLDLEDDLPKSAPGLKIEVADGDLVGRVMVAAACIGLGIPFLILIEMQWVFFLWPLRLITLGALGLGVLFAHSALTAWQRKNREQSGFRARRLLREAAFWLATLLGGGLIYTFLYLK